MTKVNFDINRLTPGIEPLTGTIEVKPTQNIAINNKLIVKDPFTIKFDGKPVTIELEPTTGNWVWNITITVPGIISFTGNYIVPDQGEVAFHNLIQIGEEAFDGNPEEAWWAMARSTINTGTVDTSGDLILTRTDGVEVNAGHVKGEPGKDGDPGKDGVDGDDGAPGRDSATAPTDRGDWCTYGDSITAANLYQPHVRGIVGFDATVNRGISARTMADGTTSGAGTVTTVQANTDHALYSVVTIAAGTNDFTRHVPLGTLGNANSTSFDRNTFYGAYRIALNHILANSPETQVIIFTPLKRTTSPYDDVGVNSNGNTLKDYADAVKNLGKLYAIPVVDWYGESGFNKVTIPSLTGDGLHPNTNGYKKLGRYTGHKINSFLAL